MRSDGRPDGRPEAKLSDVRTAPRTSPTSPPDPKLAPNIIRDHANVIHRDKPKSVPPPPPGALRLEGSQPMLTVKPAGSSPAKVDKLDDGDDTVLEFEALLPPK